MTGTTYYLDPSGSDSNNGSSSSPWKTLAYACSKANVSGDIIHINAGTYIETAECSVAVGVSIVGAGKTTTIIKSHFATSRANLHPSHASITLSSGNQGTNGNQSINNLTLDGDNLVGTSDGSTAYIGILVYQRSNVIIHDCIIQNFFTGGVLFHGCPAYTQPSIYASGNQVYNSSIINCVDEAETYGSAGLIEIGGQTEMEIHNNILTQNSRAAGHNGDILVSVYYEKGIKVYNNVFTKINDDGSAFNFHIEIWDTRGGWEVYNNDFYGGDCVMDIAGNFNTKGTYAYSWYIHNNNFHGNTAGRSSNGNRFTIIIEDDLVEDVIIQRNHFDHVQTAISISNGSVSTSSVSRIDFSYNILDNCGWYNNDWTNLVAITGDGSGCVIDGVNIYNNVILGNSSKQSSGINITSGGAIFSNINIKNNIIERNTNGGWLVVSNGGSINGLHVENNLAYDNANSNNPVLSGNSISNYTFSSNIISDPLFVSSSDYHLQILSPAIGKGLSVSGLVADYDGSAIKSPPSIGAYESGSTAQTSPPVVPAYQSSVVQNTTPSLLELTYDLTLNNAIVPAVSSFIVKVNSFSRIVNAVTASGTKVKLTLASRIFPGDVVTIAYTKPATNPIQTASGGTATSISDQQVINNCINAAPTAVITSPLTNSSFSASADITITASALDTDGSVALVEFYSGSTKLGSKSSAPYTFTWNNVTAGNYSLTVTATDNLNAKTTASSISISVINASTKRNQHPIVKILNPSKGIKFDKLSTVTIDAIASDSDGSVSKVEFYSGSVKLVELTSAPYTYSWKDVVAGNYSIIAIATDNLNDTTVSSPVKFEVGSTVKYDVNSEIVKLYPNPNNGHFSVEFINPLQNDKSEIIITDLSGKQIYNGLALKEETLKQIDVSGSRSGIYVMMIKDKEILVTKKFIKN